MSTNLDSTANGTMFFVAVTTTVVGLFVSVLTLMPSASVGVTPPHPRAAAVDAQDGHSTVSEVRLVRDGCGIACS